MLMSGKMIGTPWGYVSQFKVLTESFSRKQIMGDEPLN
jgi:hypothetical protein